MTTKSKKNNKPLAGTEVGTARPVKVKARSSEENFPPLLPIPSPTVPQLYIIIEVYQAVLDRLWRAYSVLGERRDFPTFAEYCAFERFILSRGMFNLEYTRVNDYEAWGLIESVHLSVINDEGPRRPSRVVSDLNDVRDHLTSPVGRLVAERGQDFMRGERIFNRSHGVHGLEGIVTCYALNKNKDRDKFSVKLSNGKTSSWNARACELPVYGPSWNPTF